MYLMAMKKVSQTVFIICNALVFFLLMYLFIIKEYILAGPILGFMGFIDVWAYDSFLNIPGLDLVYDQGNPTRYKPRFAIPDSRSAIGVRLPEMLSLRGEVINKGKKAGDYCQIKLKILERPVIEAKDCEAPSRELDEYTYLTWCTTQELGQTVTPGGNDLFNIAFQFFEFSVGDSQNGKLQEANWHDSSRCGRIIAYVACFDPSGNYAWSGYPIQYGLIAGRYKIRIGVFPKNTSPTYQSYHLDVSNTGLDLTKTS